jgi:hypothetical protein
MLINRICKLSRFYGNIWFEDKIVKDKENISINNLMAIDPKLEYKYVLFLNGQYSPEEDQQKLTEFILYLKNSQVYAADIDFVFFKNEPDKSAEEVPMYYVSNPDVDKVIKVRAKEFKQLENKEDIETLFEGKSILASWHGCFLVFENMGGIVLLFCKQW